MNIPSTMFHMISSLQENQQNSDSAEWHKICFQPPTDFEDFSVFFGIVIAVQPLSGASASIREFRAKLCQI